jgi:arylsulfatase A-like enzyme
VTLNGQDLSTAYSTLASWLNGAGYATALFGKWHLGSRPEFSPNAHGFDEFLGFHPWTINYYTHQTADGKPGLYRNHCAVERDGYLTDILTDEAVRFIECNADGPFFVYLAYNTALPPYQPPGLADHARNSGWDVNEASRQDYVGMVEAMDAGVGKVLATLGAQGLGQSTLVIFTYDHGGRHLVRSQPLFHGFATLWEGGIRVPMILRGPGRIPANHTSSQPAISMDITATILDFVGLGNLIPALDGISLLPSLTQEQEHRERPLFWRINHPSFSTQKAARRGRWKYLVDGDGGTQFLFDLEVDIGERRNLFYLRPDVVAELQAALAAWEASVF